jgi:aminoglycoside 2''-phosphotransferase
VKLNLEGQFNTVLEIDNAWIFRFPKYGLGIELIEKETSILPMLRRHLPLAVPNAEYIHIDQVCVKRTFMGYQMIPGQALYQGIWSKLAQDKKKAIIKKLGEFLTTLHAVDDPLIVDRLTEADQLFRWELMLDELSKFIFPLISEQSRKEIKNEFEQFLSDSQVHTFHPVVRHGDFGPSNIVFCSKSGTISGVIDFSSIALGDPAVDIASLTCLGPEVMQFLPDNYPINDTIIRRMAFYKRTFALQEALAGYKTKDENALQRGIAAYQ